MSDSDSLFKSKYYFDLKEAVTDISYSFGGKDKSIASAKLLGKTIANVAVFSGKFGIEVIKQAPDFIAKKAEESKKS